MTTKLIQELVGLAVEKSAKVPVNIKLEFAGSLIYFCVLVGGKEFSDGFVISEINTDQLQAAIDKIKEL